MRPRAIIVHEGTPEGSETTGAGGRICETGFKPGVKERELWKSRVVNQKGKK